MKKKYLKIAVKLFFNSNPIAISGLSNEMICILAAYETAKLPNVMVGRLQPLETHGCKVSHLKRLSQFLKDIVSSQAFQ